MEAVKQATLLLASYGAEIVEVSMNYKYLNILHLVDLITLSFVPKIALIPCHCMITTPFCTLNGFHSEVRVTSLTLHCCLGVLTPPSTAVCSILCKCSCRGDSLHLLFHDAALFFSLAICIRLCFDSSNYKLA